MKHITFSTFESMAESGPFFFFMLIPMHETYCNKVVTGLEIDNAKPTCEACIEARVEEEVESLGDLQED